MLKSENELINFYQKKILMESMKLEKFSTLSNRQENQIETNIINVKHRVRRELVSALVAVAVAGFCFALTPLFPYRHFDQSLKVISELKIDKQDVIEYAQAVSLSFSSR